MALDNTDWNAAQWLSRMPTADILAELRRRYEGERLIRHYVGLIEIEVTAKGIDAE